MVDMHRFIRFRDLSISSRSERQKYLSAIDRVYQHGRFILGPEVEELESSLSKMSDRDYVVGVNSGTSAIFSVLYYLKSLASPGKKFVIVPAITWVATAQAVVAAGLIPLFADVDKEFFLDQESFVDIDKSSILAVVAVDFTGRISASYARLIEWCDKECIYLVQDSAQAFGAWRRGNDGNYLKSCSIGFASCLSINSMKVLSSHGEAGAVLTDDPDLADFVKRFRSQGCDKNRMPIMHGLNLRMETLQAALILVNLEQVPDLISARNNVAQHYYRELRSLMEIRLPSTGSPSESLHTFYTYQILLEERDALKKYLSERGVETQIQYEYSLSTCEGFNGYPTTTLHNATYLANHSLCLPCHEKLSGSDLTYITDVIKEFFGLIKGRRLS